MQKHKSQRPTHDEITALTKLFRGLPEDKRHDLLEYGNKMLDLHATHARIIGTVDPGRKTRHDTVQSTD